MDFYVISPVSNLEPMRLGDRIFVLAHLWVQFPAYQEFIFNLIEEDPGRWITLDNSAAERALVTEDVLIDICHELMPSEVIAPDVLFDKDATIANAVSFRNRLEEEGLLNMISLKKLIVEGRYDSLVTALSRKLLQVIKDSYACTKDPEGFFGGE